MKNGKIIINNSEISSYLELNISKTRRKFTYEMSL
jgi:hypothetical protein